MNDFIITKSILNELYDDKTFKDEVCELINSLIDSELLKEEPDFELIDECVDVLIEVQSGNYSAVIPFIAKNRFENADAKRKVLSIFAACAVILSLSFGAVAVSHTVEKKIEEQKSETLQSAQQTTEKTETTTSSEASTTEITEKVDLKAVKMKLEFSQDFKSDYKSGEELNLNGITVNIEYSDGTKRKVNINDCKIIKSENFGKNDFIEKVTVQYKGVSDSFFVTFGENVADLKTTEFSGFEITHYTGFEKSTEAPKIQASSQYAEVKSGESISIPMNKNNDGFVCFTTDNDILDDISVSYLGGRDGRQIYLNVTAGENAGTETVFLAYERNPDDIMAQVTVKVIDNSDETDSIN